MELYLPHYNEFKNHVFQCCQITPLHEFALWRHKEDEEEGQREMETDEDEG